MPDDPRDILKAAGVECAEVDEWAEQVLTGEFSELKTVPEALSIIGPLKDVVVTSNAAILAVARLVARYKFLYEAETSPKQRAVLAIIPFLGAPYQWWHL